MESSNWVAKEPVGTAVLSYALPAWLCCAGTMRRAVPACAASPLSCNAEMLALEKLAKLKMALDGGAACAGLPATDRTSARARRSGVSRKRKGFISDSPFWNRCRVGCRRPSVDAAGAYMRIWSSS